MAYGPDSRNALSLGSLALRQREIQNSASLQIESLRLVWSYFLFLILLIRSDWRILKPVLHGSENFHEMMKEGLFMSAKTAAASPSPRPGSILWITTCGLFMALTILLSSFGVPVPGGKLYLCDVAITTASLLLDPVGAMLVGGLGSFIGDALFYPAPMYVSLVVHGLQAYAISWIAHNTFRNKPLYGAILGVSVGVVILVTGYTLGKIFIYSTFEYAMLKLPWEIMQGVIGAAAGVFLTYGCGLKKVWQSRIHAH